MRKFLAELLLTVMLVAPASAQFGPMVHIANTASLPKPLPYPYDEKTNAMGAVAESFTRARASGKRVLIDFGGNWCPDCRILAGVMNLPEVKSYVSAHYEVVTVDVGRFDRNLSLVRQLGISKLDGVPTVVIAEPDGTPLNITNSADLTNARGMNPQWIADWLARWAK
jgi:thiol-disulfide isomerase/thioredoxin